MAVAVAVAGTGVAVGEAAATEAAVGVAVGALVGALVSVAVGAVVPPRQAASKLVSAPAIMPTNVRRETAGCDGSTFFSNFSSTRFS